jgi:hypothetical protein
MGRMSSHQFEKGCKVNLSLPSSTILSVRNTRVEQNSYRVVEVVLLRALLLVSLDDTELGLILGILHHMPVECLTSATFRLETKIAHLLVLSVDTSSFDQFRLELLDSVLQVSRNAATAVGRPYRLGLEVDDDSVDHFVM